MGRRNILKQKFLQFFQLKNLSKKTKYLIIVALVALLLMILGNTFTTTNHNIENNNFTSEIEQADQVEETISKDSSTELIVTELEESFEEDLQKINSIINPPPHVKLPTIKMRFLVVNPGEKDFQKVLDIHNNVWDNIDEIINNTVKKLKKLEIKYLDRAEKGISTLDEKKQLRFHSSDEETLHYGIVPFYQELNDKYYIILESGCGGENYSDENFSKKELKLILKKFHESFCGFLGYEISSEFEIISCCVKI